MHKTPLVSIITPFFNTPVKFFQEAIQSVFDQTYSNWELILVDDGSTDLITRQALSFASQNPGKIYYYEHDQHINLGHSAARNLGIRNAKGKYIAFLDSDDVWKEHKLERQVPILENYPDVGMVYANTKYWFSWTNHPNDVKRDFIPKLGLPAETIIDPPALLPLFLNGEAAVPSMNTLLVRKDVVDKCGGFEEIFRSLYGDQHFYAKVCLHERVYVLDECVDLYRQHAKSTTGKAFSANNETAGRKFFLEWLEAYMRQQEISNLQVWRELRREMWRLNLPEWFPANSRLQKVARWIKKWMLRMEEHLLPDVIRNQLWKNK